MSDLIRIKLNRPVEGSKEYNAPGWNEIEQELARQGISAAPSIPAVQRPAKSDTKQGTVTLVSELDRDHILFGPGLHVFPEPLLEKLNAEANHLFTKDLPCEDGASAGSVLPSQGWSREGLMDDIAKRIETEKIAGLGESNRARELAWQFDSLDKGTSLGAVAPATAPQVQPPSKRSPAPIGGKLKPKNGLALSRFPGYEKLTEKQAKVAEYRYERGMSVPEIARIMGKHRKTIDESLAGADKKLGRPNNRNGRSVNQEEDNIVARLDS